MKKLILVTLFVLSVSANSVLAYDGWSGQHKINSVRVYSEDIVLVVMQGAQNPGGCSDVSYLQLDVSSASGERRYTALLTAYASGKTVNLALTGCSSGGSQGYPIIEQVWLV